MSRGPRSVSCDQEPGLGFMTMQAAIEFAGCGEQTMRYALSPQGKAGGTLINGKGFSWGPVQTRTKPCRHDRREAIEGLEPAHGFAPHIEKAPAPRLVIDDERGGVMPLNPRVRRAEVRHD